MVNELIWAVCISLVVVASILIFMNFRKIKKHFIIKKYSTFFILIFILFVAFYIRQYSTPHIHFVHYDEQYTMSAAKYFLEGYVGDNKDGFFIIPQSVPPTLFFIIPFAVFGVSSSVAFGVTLVVSLLTILVVFYLVRFLFNETAGLWAAFFLAFEKTHIFWSGTAYDHVYVTFLFFVGLLFLFFSREKGLEIFSLVAILVFLYSIYIRLELLVIIPVVFLFFVLFYLKFENKKFYGLLLLEFLALFPLISIIKFKMGMPGSSEQVNFALNFFSSSSMAFKQLISNFNYPLLLIVILLILPLVCFNYIKKYKKELIILIIPVILFHITYLLLASLKSRYLLISYVLLIACSSFFFVILKKKFKLLYYIFSIILILLVIVPIFNSCNEYSCYDDYTKLCVIETNLPELLANNFPDCSIVTDYPEIFLTEDLDVIFPEEEMIESRLEENSCVLFYDGLLKSSLDSVNQSFILEPFKIITDGDYGKTGLGFTIYRIKR